MGVESQMITHEQTRVVVFLSGKGGSGKTTVAIAVAKLLAEMDYPTLLIDFDLATNGASYFFQKYFTHKSKGIWDMVTGKDNAFLNGFLENISLRVYPNFSFVPSRVDFSQKGKSYDSISHNVQHLKKDILRPLIEFAGNKKTRYVLIDCQAGYSTSSIAAAEVADTVIVVTEADGISSDAAENLLIQLGNSLPVERRYLVNKIDVRDAETYRNMRNVFQALNRLPPLPFDFAVRNAFGARQIPVAIDEPSPLLFALFETIKFMFPEIYERIEEYKRSHVDILFDKYDKQLQDLLKEKERLEQKQAEIRNLNRREKVRIIRYASQAIAVVVLLVTNLIVFYSLGVFSPASNGREFRIFSSIAALFVGTIIASGIFYASRRFERQWQTEAEREDLSRKLEEVNRELDGFRSLLWAKSKEFLVDAEIAKSASTEKEPTIPF